VQFTRTAGAWYRNEDLPSDVPSQVPILHWPGSVLIQGWDSRSLTRSKLREIAPFFPATGSPEKSNQWETYEYPVPLSPEFWRAYAEPVSEFVRGALILRDAVEAMSLKKIPRSKKDKERFAHLGALDFLLNPVGMTYRFQNNVGLKDRPVAGSLLATLAVMALQALPKGQVRECDECGAVFISGAHPWTRFCSKRCRGTAQQRTYRLKHPKREE
jgi:hypothetical protein